MMLATPYGPVHFTLNEEAEYPERFFEWVQSNWHVYQAFVEMSREGKRKGLQHWSAKAIFEVIRWQTALRQNGEPQFKLNNSYTSGMARIAMRQFPDLGGFFRCRNSIGFDLKCG